MKDRISATAAPAPSRALKRIVDCRADGQAQGEQCGRRLFGGFPFHADRGTNNATPPLHETRIHTDDFRGAVRHGFSPEMWTGKRIAQVIRERFRAAYHFKSIPYLLRTLGWSWQKPQKRAAERDEAAIARWVREDWPRIKEISATRGDDPFRG